jgi:hypothetical protein
MAEFKLHIFTNSILIKIYIVSSIDQAYTFSIAIFKEPEGNNYAVI